MNKNQISKTIDISYNGFWQKTCITCLRNMKVNNFDRIRNVIKITLEPDLMEWIDELLFDRVNEIGSGWIYKEKPEEPEEFFWWVDILESISEQIERERRKRSKKESPKLLLSRKQLLALQTALYQYTHNANTWSDNEDDKIRDLYIKDLKNVSYVMGIIARQLHGSIKDECKYCSRTLPSLCIK